MIYVVNETTGVMVCKADTLFLAEDFVSRITPVDPLAQYSYLRRVHTMRYVSRTTYVDGVCIFNNKNFWLNQAYDVEQNYASHTVTDPTGGPVSLERFAIERRNNCTRIGSVDDTPAEVDYNITVGFEFVSLFREECILGDLGAQSAMGIAAATANLIPLVITGSFREARVVLSSMTPDSFLTAPKLARYRTMLAAADIITYQAP
jgi:hypothetical protein